MQKNTQNPGQSIFVAILTIIVVAVLLTELSKSFKF